MVHGQLALKLCQILFSKTSLLVLSLLELGNGSLSIIEPSKNITNLYSVPPLEPTPYQLEFMSNPIRRIAPDQHPPDLPHNIP